MQEKQTGKNIILAIGFLVLLSVSFCYVNGRLCRKVADTRYYDLIHGEADPEVVFVGSSRVMDAVIPEQLWEEHGITSYLLCAEYNDMRRDIAMCKLAFQYCKPKLIVLDVGNYWSRSDAADVLAAYHEYADAFPLNRVKVETTLELYGYSMNSVELLFPIYRYHERWKELSRKDFRHNKTESFEFKGFEYSAETEQIERYPFVEAENGVLLTEGTDVDYIREFIDWSRSQGIEVMLVSVPYNAMEDEQAALWGIAELARECDVPYLNMVAMEDLVDPSYDFKNEFHMNYRGAEKVTARLGEYIADQWVELEQADEATTQYWNASAEAFREHLRKLEEEEDK